jgi:hypothetical protein
MNKGVKMEKEVELILAEVLKMNEKYSDQNSEYPCIFCDDDSNEEIDHKGGVYGHLVTKLYKRLEGI